MKSKGLLILAIGLFLCVPFAQAGWEPVKRITWTSGGSRTPDLAVDSLDHLHLVWIDDTPGNDEIFYKRSTNAGATWTSNRRLTWTSGDSRTPRIAAGPSDTLHVVWLDYTVPEGEVFYKKSADGGASWTAKKRITWTSENSGSPAITIDSSGTLHLVWNDKTPGNDEIFCKKSTDGGATWTPGKRLTVDPAYSFGPAVAAEPPDNLHLVWWDDNPGNFEIYYRKSTDGGDHWLSSKRITWNSGFSNYPAIAVGPAGRVHVAWYDDAAGNLEIYYKNSPDGGTTWKRNRRLTWNSEISQSPSLAVDNWGDVHLVWFNGMSESYEIYYRKSTDGGGSWATSQRLSWNSGFAMAPKIVVDSSGSIHVVWQDQTPGNYEIYYRKGS